MCKWCHNQFHNKYKYPLAHLTPPTCVSVITMASPHVIAMEGQLTKRGRMRKVCVWACSGAGWRRRCGCALCSSKPAPRQRRLGCRRNRFAVAACGCATGVIIRSATHPCVCYGMCASLAELACALVRAPGRDADVLHEEGRQEEGAGARSCVCRAGQRRCGIWLGTRGCLRWTHALAQCMWRWWSVHRGLCLPLGSRGAAVRAILTVPSPLRHTAPTTTGER